jgi:signal transduction histidine kinase
MARGDHRHRAYLFLAAVLLPSAVLVGTTLQVIRQERELSEQRREDVRASLARRLGRELLTDLQELSQELSERSLSRTELYRFEDSHPGVLTTALARNGGLTFPWELRLDPESGISPLTLTRYHGFLKAGEEAEFRHLQLQQAAESYDRAARLFENGSEAFGEAEAEELPPGTSLRAEALVRKARALRKAGQPNEASAVYHELAILPPTLTDREGLPFSIYALTGLCLLSEDPNTLLPLLAEMAEARRRLSALALLAWQEVAGDVAATANQTTGWEGFSATRDSMAQRWMTVEALEDLRMDFPAVLRASRTNGEVREGESGSVWIRYGDEPWMVGVLRTREESATPVVVAQPSIFLESAEGYGEDLVAAARTIRLLPAGEEGGETLGPGLSGLRASFPPDFPPPEEGGTVEGWFYRLLLPVILILTAFTAYLAWRDARREAEAVRLRSQFVSSVTHELKTPLTSIRMFAETLQLGRHSGPEAQQEYLDTVVLETERLSRLINNVLDFARIERGEKTYHMAPTDVGAAAREAARAVAYPLAQGGYALNKDIPEDLPVLEADSDALTQALLNLLSNAIKFSAEGSRIDLRVFREKGDLLLQVEDRGKGIAVQDQEAIFRDFYRTADSEKEGIPGTGLGLALVAHVAEAHGGRVEVESEVERGSTFTIRIPVEEAP